MADEALELTIKVGRRLGGSSLIVASALRTAFLCLRRSSEVHGLTREQIGEAGIQWAATKRRNGHRCKSGLILWSDELRATIDVALTIERPFVACSCHVFGNPDCLRRTAAGASPGPDPHFVGQLTNEVWV